MLITITIDLNNLDDNDPVISNDTVAIDENLADGSPVYDVNEANTGNDTDRDGDALTYAISGGNIGGAFAIDSGTGEITVNDSSVLDYENIQSFDLQITAKGVETINQMEALRQLHVDSVQGFYYGRPMPLAELGPIIMRGDHVDCRGPNEPAEDAIHWAVAS